MNKKENQKEMVNEQIDEVKETILNEEENPVDNVEVLESTPKKKTSNKKKLTSEIEQLKKDLGEMKDKYLRVFAEFDNYRKRTIKERQDIIKLASRDCLGAMLPAVDDFARAIKLAEENKDEAGLPEGIVLIYNKLFKSLEQQGIKEMDSTGQDFDPELHEALTKIPAPSEDMKGKVIETIEKGYYLNDKIIRYAKVVVGE
jgi:molecular chaperone GrpE